MHAQGNFSRAEILRWHEDGYFGLDLPLRCAKDGQDSPLRPLGEWMHEWERGGTQLAPPPGFSSAAAATPGERGAMPASAQTPAVSQASASQRPLQDEPGLDDIDGKQHSAHRQLHDEHLPQEVVAARHMVVFPASASNGVPNHQQGQRHYQNIQYGTTMQASPRAQRSVDASQLVVSANGSLEQMQQQQQQAIFSQRSAALSSGYAQQQRQHPQQQQFPLPHDPVQQLLLQPNGLPPSLLQQQSALQTELNMGGAPPSLAAQAEASAVAASLRPRLPAFAQLRAGGSSQDAEQEADVNELIELLRQPVSCECMVIFNHA